MRISSFNIQNNFYKHINKTDYLISFINKYDLDILGVQEYLYRDSKKFKLNGYKCYGKGRYKYINSIFNETCSIITKLKVKSYRNIKLPWFFSQFPRIITEALINVDDKEYLILNTHLDYLHKFSQKRQLNFIIKYLKNIKYKNIIMMGDFNLDINSKLFKNFINEINKLNINRVDINEKTFKSLDKPIDHIFISNNIVIKDIKVIKSIDISDHYPLYIEVE